LAILGMGLMALAISRRRQKIAEQV
jgi:hypothetical protein